MQVVVFSTEEQKGELLSKDTLPGAQLVWINEAHEFQQHAEGDAFMDLLFQKEKSRIELLKQLLPKPVIINSVSHTLGEINPSFIRINGWTTFLKGEMVEGSCLQNDIRSKGEQIFQQLNKKIEWLNDEPGFVTPRVISAIINEAYFALAEGVSTKEEMDTAMKLGTAYPYGPFEWSKKIGLQNIVTLLNKLSLEQQRYTPCSLLVQETAKAI